VIIDDTPGVVIVSCFDPVRREIARISLERLVADGRIHPARIEGNRPSAVSKEMDDELIQNSGKERFRKTNLPNLPKAIIPMLGRLAFRTSYGQNVLRHSLEVAYLAQVMAEELGLDGTIASRRVAARHRQSHGPRTGRRPPPDRHGNSCGIQNESEAVMNAALAHHGDVRRPPLHAAGHGRRRNQRQPARRPPARAWNGTSSALRESGRTRHRFDGVRQAMRFQAGREVRVIVDAKLLDIASAPKIAHDIAKKIQDEMTYPGEIK